MELNQRERILLFVAAVIFIPLLIFRFAVIPLHDYRQKQSTSIKSMENKIHQINQLGQELKHLELSRKNQTAPLSRRIDSLLRRHQLKTRSSTIVDNNAVGWQRLVLKLDEINLTELVQLTYEIEDSNPVIAISSIEINPAFQNKKRFRLSFVLSSW